MAPIVTCSMSMLIPLLFLSPARCSQSFHQGLVSVWWFVLPVFCVGGSLYAKFYWVRKGDRGEGESVL